MATKKKTIEVDILKETDERESYWRDRNDQIDEDRKLISLIHPTSKSDEKRMVSNEPKVFYDTAVALLSSYPPRFRLPLTINHEPEERDKINKAERFIAGVFRGLDRRQLARGQAYWMRELAWWVCSGWYAVFTTVQKKGKETEFVADMWDPATVFPEWDSDGLVKCVRTFETDNKTAQTMVQNWQAIDGKIPDFKETTHDNRIKVINYWRRDRGTNGNYIRNAIYIQGQPIKVLQEEDYEEIPIHIGAIGQPEMGSPGWKKRQGENIIAADRNMYYEVDELLSLMKTILSETAYPNLLSKTTSGAPAVRAEDVKGGGGQVIPIRLQDQLELMKNAATPQEGFELLSHQLRQISKGSFPDVVYGGLQVEISGFALSQLLAAIRYKIGPYWNTMQYIMSQVATDFLIQFKKKGGKISLPVQNPQSMKRGLLYVEEYTRADVPERAFVDVTIPITSTLDKTQQLIQARQALDPPQLLSRETLWDDFLDVQDSEQEYARILQDETLELPVVKELMMLEQLRKRADALRENGQEREADALHQHIMILEMNLGLRQGIPERGGGGVPPNVLPPEMQNNPDARRAATGQGPPGLNRRPQTPQEREQSQGRKGRLVSPSGEVLLR